MKKQRKTQTPKPRGTLHRLIQGRHRRHEDSRTRRADQQRRRELGE